ncbi:MAG: FkbM family methyltransferase [Flavobacteriales bacterium]|nr:FkbM family methyltransferase [Flavobacteriales bacterium]
MGSLSNVAEGGLRWLMKQFPVRGRHRLADMVGKWPAEKSAVREINGIRVELDRDIQYHRMMLFDLYEENIMNYLRKRLKPGMVVLDPGCNIGYFAAQVQGMVYPGGRVLSMEPSPTCLARVQRLNPVGKVSGWQLLPMALTDRTGKHTFFDTPRVISHGYAALEGANTPGDRIPVEVDVTSLDDLCTVQGITHIDFLKLDIEDSELPALKGATRMLSTGAIDTIMVETEIRADRNGMNAEIFKLLRNSGFAPFHVNRNGSLSPVEPERMPPHREDLIWERDR